MKRFIIYIILVLPIKGISQTCCSGGVPLSGNIGFIEDQKGLMQLEINYDYNYLNNLYFKDSYIDANSRERKTQSVLLKYGYNISNSFSFDLLFSFVQQEREISQFGNKDYIRTRGIGDALILIKYQIPKISNNKQSFLIGIGPKLPLGKSNLKTISGINLNADLQPGSGSYDMIFWSHYQRKNKLRPSFTYFSRFIYKLNGSNTEYFETQTYKFGDEINLIAGIGDQFLFKNIIINLGVALKYRRTESDLINNNELPNTGGNWLYAVPNLGIFINKDISINISLEFPIYTNVTGTQLSTNFRLSTGIYFKFNNKPSLNINKL